MRQTGGRTSPFRCPKDRYCPPPNPHAPEVIGFAEPAGAERAPAYASLDVHLEKGGHLFGLPFGLFLQVRNTLNRSNRSAYEGSVLHCDEAEVNCHITDLFEEGMPLFPLLGFWMRL